jgi:UDP-N-acetyl-D-glucosamine dehydrogenase
MTTTKQELCQKIKQRKANITVIGLGYVGLPMCVEFAHKGFFVAGVDKDAEKIKQLKAGKSYIMDISPETLQSIQRNFSPTTNFHVLSEADVVIICVPTPLNKTKDPDLSYIAAATAEIKKNLQPNQLIILESTTYPGTTDEIVLPQLEETGLKVGRDFFLAFSPERIDPGNATWNFRNTPKIVGGVTTDCGELAELLYTDVVDRVVRVSSSKSAEMVKLLENTFRAINIAMVNEVAIMCNKLGIDTWEVIDAAATKPFGYMPFYPGPGLGGHCIPIDPQYLSWKLKMLNYSAKFIELADEINSSMPEYVVTKITDALNFESKSVKGSKIVLLGVAYKKNSNDLRESPALDIAKLLKLRGADVVYHDPYIPQMILDSETIHSEELTPSLLKQADCVVIVTDHEDYDWQFVVDHSKLILDTRNAVRKTRAGKSRIVKL